MSKENLGFFHGTAQQLRFYLVVHSTDTSLSLSRSFSEHRDLQPSGEAISQGF